VAKPILITGFNAFGDDTRNPSQAVVEAIAGSQGFEDVRAEVLPTEFARAGTRIVELLKELQPTAWIGFGLHKGATGIVLERRAVNMDDARIPDNAADQRSNGPINPDGPAELPSTLPLDSIAAGLTDQGIPHTYSDSAGRFVCNHVFYKVISTLVTAGLSVPAGFIHLPWPVEWGPVTAVHEVTVHQLIEAASVVIKKTRGHRQIHLI
jgi:pyroglutamyl-peptidase